MNNSKYKCPLIYLRFPFHFLKTRKCIGRTRKMAAEKIGAAMDLTELLLEILLTLLVSAQNNS